MRHHTYSPIEMKANKLLVFLVVVLIAINITSLFFLIPGSKKGKHGKEPHKPAQFLTERIGFDETQKARFMELVDEHKEAMRPLQRQIMEAHRTSILDRLSDKDNGDQNDQALCEVMNEMTILHFEHFDEVMNLCNEEQKKKFEEILPELLSNMFGGRGPGHGPPPGHHRPPPPMP